MKILNTLHGPVRVYKDSHDQGRILASTFSSTLLVNRRFRVNSSTGFSWPTYFGVNGNLKLNWKSWTLSTVLQTTVEL